MPKDDPYDALDLDQGAGAARVYKAYHGLTVRVLRRLHTAYKTLWDPKGRSEADAARWREMPWVGDPPKENQQRLHREGSRRVSYARRRGEKADALSSRAVEANAARIQRILDDDDSPDSPDSSDS